MRTCEKIKRVKENENMWTKIADIIVKIALVIWLIGSLVLVWSSAENVYSSGYFEEGRIILIAVILYIFFAIIGIAIAAFVEVTIEISEGTQMIRRYLLDVESEIKSIAKIMQNNGSNNMDDTTDRSRRTVPKVRDTEYLYQKQEQTTWKCIYCGFENESSYKFCMECGTNREM